MVSFFWLRKEEKQWSELFTRLSGQEVLALPVESFHYLGLSISVKVRQEITL